MNFLLSDLGSDRLVLVFHQAFKPLGLGFEVQGLRGFWDGVQVVIQGSEGSKGVTRGP